MNEVNDVSGVVMRDPPMPTNTPIVVTLKLEIGEFTGMVTDSGRFKMTNGGEWDGYWYGTVSGWRYA